MDGEVLSEGTKLLRLVLPDKDFGWFGRRRGFGNWYKKRSDL